MNRLLIAVDRSKGSLRAVEYVAEQFAKTPELRVTLLHVLPGLPSQFWDDGHILTKEENEARQKVIDKWRANEKLLVARVFQQAAEKLVLAGIDPARIETKVAASELDSTAESILAAAKTGEYKTLVIGRNCTHPPTAHALIGSLANTIVNHASGVTVCVVG
ncbi:MAG TPA: hypothetical protein DEB40_06050 [Elusimicrobia bacterium]|nr:hypothetical protein [Elusimicrobiota bacterium]HBT61289.1 hypothetical protein [Elusimicrobiota bacterium]